MTTALDVASYMNSKLPLGMYKTQKLLYLVQAWSLGYTGRPVFDESFEAWVNGPVVRNVYRVQRHEVMPRYAGQLSPAEEGIVDAVLKRYESLTTKELVDLTHEDAPWQQAREGLKPDQSSTNHISVPAIRRLYVQKASNPFDAPKIATTVRRADEIEVEEATVRLVDSWRSALDLLAER